jgi:hypothetical protein
MYDNLKRTGIICFLLLSFSPRVSAPICRSVVLPWFPQVEPYTQLINAIATVETGGDTLAYNPLEEAVGILQIRPVRLIDYNRRTGSSINREDLFNYDTSEKIFLYYASQIGPYNLEKIARKWNGSGEMTDYYWTRIRKYLQI